MIFMQVLFTLMYILVGVAIYSILRYVYKKEDLFTKVFFSLLFSLLYLVTGNLVIEDWFYVYKIYTLGGL